MLMLPTSATQALCKCLLSKMYVIEVTGRSVSFCVHVTQIVCIRSLHSTFLHDMPWLVLVTSTLNVRLMYPLLTHLGPSENTSNHPWDWLGFWSCMQYKY